MRHRESILQPLGYVIEYRNQPNYHGARNPNSEVCIARKADAEFHAIIAKEDSDLNRYRRIQVVQDSIANMARIELIEERVVLFAKAQGNLLWHHDPKPDVSMVERELMNFAESTRQEGLIHGDLRPWNIFIDDQNSFTVIDWEFASFIDELPTRGFNTLNHYKVTHNNLSSSRFADIDAIDAEHIVSLLNGNISCTIAWGVNPPLHGPSWCQI